MANPPETAVLSLAYYSGFIGSHYVAKLYARKNCLLPPLSSTTSTRPGFNCSMEGTWFARTPISPDSAGMLTWTTSWDL